MNLANKEVIHETFGTGNVVNYSDHYITINFKSGDKKFVFPDAFKKYVMFIDKSATNLVKKKIKKKEEERKKEALILKKERALEQERQQALGQERQMMKSHKIHSKIQSVFWCEGEEEEDRIFTEWTVFTGEIKSGKRKGEPRQFPRMNQNSGCLITRRNSDMPEKERQILGLFMTNESFNGRLCKDGYITAHPKYRLRLSEQESEKILFWNYYVDEKSPDEMIWNSGRQRYFDNIWMAQILRDIVFLKEEPQEREDAQAFFEYFCKINHINENELPNPKGALTR